jgi:hypothetical protein
MTYINRLVFIILKMSFNAKRRRIKPFARATSFDINCVYDIRHFQKVKYGNVVDPYFPSVATDEAFQVMEGEVLMMNSSPGFRRYGDHQMHAFSFANGLKALGRNLNASGGKNQAGDKKAILASLKYAGVAVTGFTPESDVFEQGFVATLAGLNSLFNNGADTIYPGDVICADIPNPADAGKRKNRALQGGVPREKLQFILTPFKVLSKQLGDSELASKFIMGTALSFSRPGNPVDVVLHRCNVFGPSSPSEDQSDAEEKLTDRIAQLEAENRQLRIAALPVAEGRKPKVKSTKKK